MELGVYDYYHRQRFVDAFDTIAGAPIAWSRRYYQMQNAASMGQIATDAAAGWKVMVSFKSTYSWENVAAGSDDARFTEIGNLLAGITNAGAWCFNHEPENDRATYGSNANGDAFCAAFNHVAEIIKPLAPNWYACANLMQYVFPSYLLEFGALGNWVANPDPLHWWPTEATLLGVDYYSKRGSKDGDVTKQWAQDSHVDDFATCIDDFLAYADGWGVPLCLPEFGYAIRDPNLTPNDVDNQIAWFNDIAAAYAGDARILFCAYFETNYPDASAYPNWAITDDTTPPMTPGVISAFAAFNEPPPPPPPPTGWQPGWVPVGTRARLIQSV